MSDSEVRSRENANVGRYTHALHLRKFVIYLTTAEVYQGWCAKSIARAHGLQNSYGDQTKRVRSAKWPAAAGAMSSFELARAIWPQLLLLSHNGPTTGSCG